MEKMTPEKMDEYLDSQIWGREAYAPSYPELCSNFAAALSKASKSAALYTLKHPMVIESVLKAFGLLEQVLAAKGAAALALSLADEAWLFNGEPVPALSQDTRQLAAAFKAHGLRGVSFLDGTKAFEIGALCEYLGSPAKNQPEGGFREFLFRRGVTSISPELVNYVKDTARGPEQAVRPVEEVRTRQPAVPAPGKPPRPAAREETPAPGPVLEPVKKRPPAKAAAPAPVPVPVPAAPPADPARTDENSLAGKSLGALLTQLVESAVRNPQERVKVYQDALKMIKESLDQQVTEATKSLAEENERILTTRARTEKVLSRVAEGKVIVDKEGRILMMNQAAEEIAGKKLSEVAGTPVLEHLNPGEHILTISDDMDLSGAGPVSGKVSFSGDEEVGRALRRSMALLQDDEGRVIGAYATLPDVAKFKETQRLQEEFLSKVTHELQSPLASISSALEMLSDTAAPKLDGDENNFLGISVRNSRRLTDMIRGILDFSKLQSGKLDIHPEAVPLGPILAEAVEGLLPWARTKGLTLTVRPPLPDVTVRADAKRVVQVLVNLLSNAIKSTPAGGTVLVASSRVTEPEPGVIIGVRDTGRGIPKDDLRRIFEKFVQLEGGETREGVGLGLAIVKELVALHRGRIWAESEPGKGATFFFTLPLAEP